MLIIRKDWNPSHPVVHDGTARCLGRWKGRSFWCEGNQSVDYCLNLQRVWNNNSELMKTNWIATLDSLWKELRKGEYREFHLHLGKQVVWTINRVRDMKGQQIRKNSFSWTWIHACKSFGKYGPVLEDFLISMECPKADLYLWDVYLTLYVCFLTRWA